MIATRNLAGLSALLVGLAAAPIESRALCAERDLPAQLLTSVHTLAAGSALLVDAGRDGVDAVRAVGEGRRPHTLALETIAEDLVRAPLPTAPGHYEIAGDVAGMIDVTGDALPEPPPAPRIARLRRRESHDSGGPLGDFYDIALTATLRGDAPTGAFLLVARWQDGEREVSAWSRLSGSPITLASLAPCGGRFEVPARGTMVRLFYLDRHGQRSPETAPIRVR